MQYYTDPNKNLDRVTRRAAVICLSGLMPVSQALIKA
jgi:hypothetical protein